jgi:hypothetical protein
MGNETCKQSASPRLFSFCIHARQVLDACWLAGLPQQLALLRQDARERRPCITGTLQLQDRLDKAGSWCRANRATTFAGSTAVCGSCCPLGPMQLLGCLELLSGKWWC